ncbi:MAG: OmpA family protein [Bacteroidia bacterium]|nr:OmpA family protein [Bacteroidia bacterium]MCX7652108.1 OmpA family protein [Bacteroidia bacterium]MDW8417498.1 OmpA family protein [Bacteroidia bacterium]
MKQAGIILLFSCLLMAQPQKAEKHIRRAEELMQIEDFGGALSEYETAMKLNPFSAEAHINAGYCAWRLRQNRKAVEYFEKAERMGVNFTPRLITAYADALQRVGQPARARPLVERLLQQLRPSDPMYASLQTTLQHLKNAEKYLEKPLKIDIRNLSGVINSPAPDYAPVISADESVLLFTSRRYGSTGGKVASDGLPYEDIYISEKQADGKWSSPRNIGPPLNTGVHDACIALSADGQTLFLFNSDNGGDIFISRLKGTKWLSPKNMGSPINSKYWEPSVCLSADERTLFFVSDRPGGMGKRDIYMCRRLPNGKWSQPINLGPPINTPYDEDGPFFHPDGKTLFYSSNGPNSMGGFDIFRTELRSDSTWSPPVNLGYPINTPGDEIYFVLSASGLHGYYASERDDSYGEKDIYLVDFSTLQVEPPPSVQKPAEAEDIQVTSEPPAITFRPNLTLLTGIIYDAQTQSPLEATITIIDNAKGDTIAVLTSNATTGKYLASLPAGRNYGIAVTADGYAFHSENFIVEESQGYREIRKDIGLEKYKAGTVIILRNVFFDFDKATLRPESKAELERVYQILVDNPKIRIRVAGHTDSMGSDEYNQKLSENRAKAVYEYLIKRGISPERVAYIGYGESKPIDTNDTEEGRQNNRRVEIEIL